MPLKMRPDFKAACRYDEKKLEPLEYGLLGPLNSAGSVIFVKSPAELLEKFLKGNL